MFEALSPEQEAKAQELAGRITARSADAILEMARRLVATTDDTLFGDTEFALRAQAQGIVADAYAEHLPQKVGTPPASSTAPTADVPPLPCVLPVFLSRVARVASPPPGVQMSLSPSMSGDSR